MAAAIGTSTLGPKSFTVSAVDGVGHVTTRTVNYTVTASMHVDAIQLFQTTCDGAPRGCLEGGVRVTSLGQTVSGAQVTVFEANVYDPSDDVAANFASCPTPLNLIPSTFDIATTFIDQQPSQKIERRLGTVGHDDLFGAALHSPRGGEVARYRLAKRRIAFDVVGAEKIDMREFGAAAEQFRPGVERKIVRIRHAGMKGKHARPAMMIGLGKHCLSAP